MQYKERSWDILLIGGASGSGKTRISLLLSRYFGVDLMRVDDYGIPVLESRPWDSLFERVLDCIR